MKKEINKPAAVLLGIGTVVSGHYLVEYVVTSYQGEAQSPSLSDMTASASDTVMVFSAATIVEPQPPKNLKAPRVHVTWLNKKPKA